MNGNVPFSDAIEKVIEESPSPFVKPETRAEDAEGCSGGL